MKSKNTLSLVAIVLWFAFASISILGQQKTTDAPCRSIGPEDNSETPSRTQDIPYCSPKKPVNCEEDNFYIDKTIGRGQTPNDTYLIVIARLGDKEISRQLNITRLKVVDNYLRMRGLKRVVTAQGESKKGYGEIEFYLEGKLLLTLPIFQKKNLDLISCNAP